VATSSCPDYKVTGDILGLALRAYVQLGDTANAKSVLDLMKRLTNEDGSDIVDSTAAAPARSLYSMQQQIEALKKQGQEKKAKEIAATSPPSWTKSQEPPSPAVGRTISSWQVLRHGGTARQKRPISTARYRPPRLLMQSRRSRGGRTRVQTYWYARVSYARQLRLMQGCKGESRKGVQDPQEIMTNPKARQHMRADFERNLVLEDLDPPRYGTAITSWGKFLANQAILGRHRKEKRIRASRNVLRRLTHYVGCCFKYSQLEDTAKKGQDEVYLNRAADWIVRMELDNPDGWQIVAPAWCECWPVSRCCGYVMKT